MRRFVLIAISALLFPSSVLAEPQSAAWKQYEEPTEKSFTVDAPKDWQIESGTARRMPSVATPWIKAKTADGVTDIFLQDGSLPRFLVPGRFTGPEGKSFTGPGGTTIVAPYKTGQEFAVVYGQQVLPAGSENVKLEQSKNEPELLTNGRANPNNMATATAGSATYSYDRHGQKRVECVIAKTMLCNPNGPAGTWSPFDVYGFHTKAGDEAHARNMTDHMRTSMKIDPQWASNMMAAIKDAGAQGMAQLNQQHQQFTQWMNNQNQQFNQSMNIQHQQAMDQIQAVGDRSRAQAQADAQWHQNAMVNHYAQMAVKDNNNYKQVLQIQNKHLEWSPDLQRNVEVPNY